jgi:sterol desaturase/sphingolipid hydroxylase (fatty acid hydroxylase superfamily)
VPREEARLKLAIILGSLLAVALWEFCRPRRRREFPALRRRLANVAFWVLNLVLAGFIFEPVARFRPRLEAVLGIALPSWPIANAGLSLVAGFLLLDLMRYLVHRCEHAVPLFWRFHALHHSDPDVDVTTAVRHHPIEYVLASAVYWLAVLVLDVPAIVALSHGLANFGTAAVQHGNIRLPNGLERWLQPALITTDLHRIHHSVSFDQANSNYGAILSVWDRLFGTYTRISRSEHERIVFGVRELPRRDGLKPSAMFLTPWLISRTRTADGPSGSNSRRLASIGQMPIPRGQRRIRSGG